MMKFLIDSLILTIVFSLVSYCVAEKPSSSPSSSSLSSTDNPKPALPIRQIIIETSNLTQIPIHAAVAATAAEQQSLLILCAGFGDNEGLLFTFQQPMPIGAWMKNCSVPVDVLFIAPTHEITSISTDRPDNPESLSSQGDAAAILEIKAGSATSLGIRAGDMVRY